MHLFRAAQKPVPTVALTIRSRIPLAGAWAERRGHRSGLRSEITGWGRLAPKRSSARRSASRTSRNVARDFGGLTSSMLAATAAWRRSGMSLPAASRFTLVVPHPGEHREERRAPFRVDSSPPRAENTAARWPSGTRSHARFELLAEALQDVYMSVPARLIPGFTEWWEAGRRAGASGVTISGAVRHSGLHAPGRGKRIGRALKALRGTGSRRRPSRAASRRRALTLRRFSSLWPGSRSHIHAVVGSKVRRHSSDRRSDPARREPSSDAREERTCRGRFRDGDATDDLIGSRAPGVLAFPIRARWTCS